MFSPPSSSGGNAMSEGGEARDHEAEVEAAIFDVLTREGVIFASRFPIGRVQAREFRQRVAKAIAALDAVRRSPQGEDQASKKEE